MAVGFGKLPGGKSPREMLGDFISGEPQERFTDFYESCRFLEEHPIFDDGILGSAFNVYLDWDAVKVNPLTKEVDDDEAKNTETRVWLECGPLIKVNDYEKEFTAYPGQAEEMRKIFPDGQPSVDHRLCCGAPTFEEAIVRLANLVFTYYGEGK
ncbi:MAG: hypothetical protein HYT12_03475 [Candidatus Liptonbacteria bacterium]|nr:hypothetical protein [Candidatus Liptonbacteria bacterium]